jgi:hypothetical protein
MKPLILLLVAIVSSLAWTQEPVLPGTAPSEQPDQKFVTLTVECAPGDTAGQIKDAPPALQALLKQGWRISQCTSLGKVGDGNRIVVALVLDQPSAEHEAAPVAEGTTAPGAAAPVAAAHPGTYHIAWDDGFETTVVVGAPAGVRSPVSVTTKEKNGAPVVSYQATAFLDSQGTMHIDGRGAPLTGPQANGYSPDSFAIHPDGTVGIRDDHANDEKGVLITNAPGAGSAPGSDAPASGQSNL